ncbi:cell division protein FtsB [Catenovulum sediminis]|uniref:Cell division protein FtsB n=1 Tax=Catenovulum sediminis TaxID=1740262 RepID=A0ABV1RGW8_9ALTE|nr:cell division protein FtsB [Catenovulum sediminis]
MKIFRLILVIVFIGLQYRLWFGENAFSEHQDMSRKVKQLEQANQELRLRNKLMLADIEDLKSGMEAIEERARNELGLIKENEIFYRIVPTTKNKNE